MVVLSCNNQLPLGRIVLTLVMPVRHSNMKGNARQPLFPPIFFPYLKRGTDITRAWIFLLTKKWG
jgi:hypothetical protein